MRRQRYLIQILLAAMLFCLPQNVLAEEEGMNPYQLISRGHVAMIQNNDEDETVSYINFLMLDDRPAYCIEPEVPVRFEEDGTGPVYIPSEWPDCDEETKMKVSRLAYYGYGHPLTGMEKDAYAATQLLIWQALGTAGSDSIASSLELCSVLVQASIICTGGKGNIPQLMEEIRNRSETISMIPSFVRQDPYELKLNESLILEDSKDVLSHFKLNESTIPEGIHAVQEGNKLTVSTDPGIMLSDTLELSFHRIDEEWNAVKAGLIVYSSGDHQRIFSSSGVEPTPGFSISVFMNSASLQIQKLDEYGRTVSGAGFIAGFDDEFKHAIHNESEIPIVFSSDEQGIVRIADLPCDTDIFLKEVSAPSGYAIDDTVFCMHTGSAGSVIEGTFADPLAELTLHLIKEDAGDASIRLNGAEYQIYELSETGFDDQEIQFGFQNESLKEPIIQKGNPLWFFHTDREYRLNDYFMNAVSFRLENDNPHIRLSQHDNSTFLYAAENSSAVLEILDEAETVIQKQRIFISSDQEDGVRYGMPVFCGATGGMYLRLTDPAHHQRPLINRRITLYQNDGTERIEQMRISDAFGTADLSDIAPGTWNYEDPITKEIRSIQITDEDQRIGRLDVDRLKHGVSYLLCETDLPEGYDYGSQNACTVIVPNAADGELEFTAEQKNERRMLKINVVKVDQDNSSIPLNDAWFTVEDLTVSKAEGSDSAVRIEDIPSNAKAGDMLYIRRARKDGLRHRWRISQVSGDSITIELFDDGIAGMVYTLHQNVYDPSAPMMYQDAASAVSSLKVGAVFELTEREDSSLTKSYRICSLIRGNGSDIFGNPANVTVIQSAVLQEGSLNPFVIHKDKIQSGNLGTYVTGGLMIQKTESQNVSLMNFEEVCLSVGGTGNLQPGISFSGPVIRTVRMPRYQYLIDQGIHSGDDFEFDSGHWHLDSLADGQASISGWGRSFKLSAQTIPGAVSFTDHAMLHIERVNRNQDAVSSIVVTDGRGSSWFLQPNAESVTAEIGRAGVYVQISEEKSFSSITGDGYTDSDGRLLFTDLAEGEWWIRTDDGLVERQSVRNGALEILNIPYGHSIRVCEVRSPLGYIIGNACEVLKPTSAYTVDTVENYRTNSRIITTVREIQKRRKMGETE